MHKEILTRAQIRLLPLVKKFKKSFGLVGGTAAALQIGHRRSVDFDLFSSKKISRNAIREVILEHAKIQTILVDQQEEYTLVVGGVKLTFYYYPFQVAYPKRLEDIITMADLATVAAMKAYALGRRAKWKDYIDLFFILKDFHPLPEVALRAKKVFGVEFNEKIFRSQLAYFRDIDYSEKIEFMPGYAVSDAAVRRALRKFSVQDA